MPARLSKSKLMSSLQCQRRLWLEVNRPEIAVVSADTQAAFATGHRVGELARDLYSQGHGERRGGHLVEYGAGLGDALQVTRRLLADGDDAPIFEATLQHAGVLVRLDVLLRNGDAPRVVEVKASTSLKDEYLADCAIQGWVAKGAGLDYRRFLLAHVDNTFVYAGDGDYRGLLTEDDITAKVAGLKSAVPGWLQTAQETLGGDEPKVPLGKRCTTPHACPFMDHCWPAGAAYPVTGLGGDRDLLGRLADAGFKDIREVPANRLTAGTQKRIWRVTRTERAELDPAAAAFVGALGWPRYYLDFETFAPAVPVFAGTRPYQPVPFQFSCHVQQRDGSLTHTGFLDLTGDDPSRRLAEALLAASGNAVGNAVGNEGPVLVYTGYEKGVIAGLAARFPDLAAPLQRLVARLVDLHPVTKQNFYHPDMLGSWSLKAVLPVIAPDLSYAALGEIRDGGAASGAYAEAIAPATSTARREEIRAGLERYCAQDTLALVRLAEFLAGGG